MNPTPEQKKVLERCARMLKQALGGLKRVIFDLAPDDAPDTVEYNVRGKVKVKP